MLPIWESLLFESRSSPDNPMAQQPPLLFILIDLFGFQLNCILNSTVREREFTKFNECDISKVNE